MSRTRPEPQQIDLAEALERAVAKRRFLLLGNGFSINARPCGYASLFRRAGELRSAADG